MHIRLQRSAICSSVATHKRLHTYSHAAPIMQSQYSCSDTLPGNVLCVSANSPWQRNGFPQGQPPILSFILILKDQLIASWRSQKGDCSLLVRCISRLGILNDYGALRGAEPLHETIPCSKQHTTSQYQSISAER